MRYCVADADHEVPVLVLRDEDGRSHVATPLSRLPAIGDELDGLQASPGFGILIGAADSQIFRIVFDLIDVPQADVLGLLHPGS
jgi:hypothetical protein